MNINASIAVRGMSKIARETDLTKLEGDPTARATLRLQRERCRLEFTMPAWLGGATVKMDTQTLAGSPLAAAVTTMLLIAAGCLAMGIAAAVSAPVWATITALFLPAAIFTVIRIARLPKEARSVQVIQGQVTGPEQARAALGRWADGRGTGGGTDPVPAGVASGGITAHG